MDYVFFAFSAMCLGLTIWLALLVLSRKTKRPPIWWVLLARSTAALFYFLLAHLSQTNETLHYLANTLPQVLLFVGLVFLLRHRLQ